MTGPLSRMVGLVEGFRPSDKTRYQVCESQNIVYCIVRPERESLRMCVVTVMGTVFQTSDNNTNFMTLYCIDMLQCGEFNLLLFGILSNIAVT